MGLKFIGNLALAVPLSISACKADETPSSWKTDCVGRMQLSVPGEVDVAATTQGDFHANVDPLPLSFADGQAAPYAGLGYLGSIQVIHGLAQNQLAAFMNERREGRNKFGKVAGKEPSAGRQSPTYRDLPLRSDSGFAFQAQGQIFLRLQLPEHAFLWEGFSGQSDAQAFQDYEAVLQGVKARATFDLPSTSGVCLPYAFIKDNGMISRSIAMAYRLRDHPDITILLRDRNAAELGSKARPESYDPQANSESFWGRHDSIYRKSLKGVWRQPYKSIRLAESKGVQSFVEIVRKDGSIDYGYLAVARGDPKAKQDRPDLMLYVLQNSRHAKAKGVAPLGKDAFIELAQGVAASVRHR